MSVKSAKDIFGLAFAVGRSRIARQLPRNFHHPSAKSATPLPLGGVGPPPSPPLPAASQYGDRIERRRKQAQMLQQAKDLRASGKQQGKQSPLKKRFWKDVDIKETPGSSFLQHLLLEIPYTHTADQMDIKSSWIPVQSVTPIKSSSPFPYPNPTSPTPSP